MTLTRRLVAQARQDEGLREDLRALAEAVLLTTGRSVALLAPASGEHAGQGDAAARAMTDPHPPVGDALTTGTAVPEDLCSAPPLPALTLGNPGISEPEARTKANSVAARTTITDAESPAIEAHCRLKAEGIRWAATRLRLKNQGADHGRDIAQRDRDFHERAKRLGCYAWMCLPQFTIPKDLALLENVAGWFETVADTVALVRGMLPDVEANREFFEPALNLLSEAQSGLRESILRIGGPNDPDQFHAFDWLRGIAAREQIFILRHMRLDDPADPTLLPEIQGRIKAMNQRVQDLRGRDKKIKSHFNRLCYHAKLIGKGTGSEHDWRKVVGAIDDLVGGGMPPSNVEIREVLLPILDSMPDLEDLPPGFNLVLREIDRYLAGRTPASEVMAADVPTAEVAEAARLLKDKCVLLVGGIRRSNAHEALEAAFGLKDLVWFETREHESIDIFEPYVARPEVALVLMAIRWSSHSFEGVKRFCNRHGKPMVRLPGGYGVNQVAAQILAQCSRQLERNSGQSGMEAA